MKKLPILLLLFSHVVSAQIFRGNQTPNDTLKTVRILPEKHVMLSIYAAAASRVSVTGDFLTDYKPKISWSHLINKVFIIQRLITRQVIPLSPGGITCMILLHSFSGDYLD